SKRLPDSVQFVPRVEFRGFPGMDGTNPGSAGDVRCPPQVLLRKSPRRRPRMNEATGASGSPAPHVLELTLQNCAELFDSSAPACLGHQAVHNDIVEHLLEQVAAAPRNAPVNLRLILPAD